MSEDGSPGQAKRKFLSRNPPGRLSVHRRNASQEALQREKLSSSPFIFPFASLGASSINYQSRTAGFLAINLALALRCINKTLAREIHFRLANENLMSTMYSRLEIMQKETGKSDTVKLSKNNM